MPGTPGYSGYENGEVRRSMYRPNGRREDPLQGNSGSQTLRPGEIVETLGK